MVKVLNGQVLHPFKVLFLSDIHLGHRRVKAKDVVTRLKAMLGSTIKNNKPDYIVIAGDIFDDGMPLADEDSLAIQDFIAGLINACYDCGILLRVLSGTDSHDRGQSAVFNTLNNARPDAMRCDLLYLDEVSVLKEADGSTWLYVPDNVHSDTEMVWDIVQEKLYEAGLSKIDFSVTHGQYTHHVPDGVQGCHDPDRYLAITNIMIDNGHIHGKSVYKKRFVTNGSFDRLDHNEESPKGMWLIEVSANGREADRFTFIENKDATRMITVDVRGLNFDEARDKVSLSVVPDLTPQFIRLYLGDALYGQGLFKSFTQDYPYVRWAYTLEKEKRSNEQNDLFSDAITIDAEIDSSNIKPLVKELLQEAGKHTPTDVDNALALLEGLL